MKIYEFIRYTLPTGGSLMGKELEPYQGKIVFLDELEDREIVFMDSDWIEDEDGTVIKVTENHEFFWHIKQRYANTC